MAVDSVSKFFQKYFSTKGLFRVLKIVPLLSTSVRHFSRYFNICINVFSTN